MHTKNKSSVQPTDQLVASAAGPFDLASLFGYRLVRLSASMGALAHDESQAVAGLSLAEYRVLVVLHAQGPCGVVALQQAMLIDKAWISRTLASLVAAKLVTSKADASDARRTLYTATPKGRRVAALLAERSVQRQQRVMQGFSKAEVGQLHELLSRLEANVQALGQQARPIP